MYFDYVDKITEYQRWNNIKGYKIFNYDEIFYSINNINYISPMLILESIAQLVDWLIRYSSDFKKRAIPVILDKAEFFKTIKTGKKIFIEGQILEVNEDFIIGSGVALDENFELMVHINRCIAKIIDISECYCVNEVKQLFDNKIKESNKALFDIKEEYSNNLQILSDLRLQDNFTSKKYLYFVDSHLISNFKKVVTTKLFSDKEPFFKWHFPKKPVVPGIFMLSCIMECAQFLLDNESNQSFQFPIEIKDCAFRKFIYPNSLCESVCEIVSTKTDTNNDSYEIKGYLKHSGNIALKTIMVFKT